MKIGIIGPSEIAFRRFLPALSKTGGIEYVGVAYAGTQEWLITESEDALRQMDGEAIRSEAKKAERFQEAYGGKVFCGYRSLLESGEVDAVYISLPPAMHFKWAKSALEYGLHVFVEKPSTTSFNDTKELVCIAEKRKLALHENYMFAFHSQLQEVADTVRNGEIGDIRLYRIDFGFPYRGAGDFRYKKELGGGALLDCGGYVLKYADMLLGGRAEIVQASVGYADGMGVDAFGSGVLKGEDGQIVQAAFGMDNDYRCSIDLWGSKGSIFSNRILTAPAGFVPAYTISKNGEAQIRTMQADDAFHKSILKFMHCIKDMRERTGNYKTILRQQYLVEEFACKAGICEECGQGGGRNEDHGFRGK
ncbi:MAG: Gfo/Idh/MocA family oxidoreductase [Eubacterium sp.]|nr:Gfo/Idh/MocA family oxidoreductase [Eubacterium sp.]